MFQACDVDDLAGLNYENVQEYGTFFGDPYRQTVIIHSQGASPCVKLHDAALVDLIKPINTNDIIIANIRQQQIIESRPLYTSELSEEEASAINNKSVTNLATVIRHFKNQNKTVYVMGTGFGGYLVQELIATYGTDIADRFLIMGSRLSTENEFIEAWSSGQNAFLDFDATPIGVRTFEETITVNANLNRLFGAIAKKNFLEKFKTANLSNVTYLYSPSDELVGPLSKVEQLFLSLQNAKTLISPGDHHSSIQDGIAEGMLEGFGLE